MCGSENATIAGLNEVLESQRKFGIEQKTDTIVSMVLFDNDCEVLHNRELVEKVKPLTEKDYFVRGSTALYDAVGGAIDHIDYLHKNSPANQVPQKTIFVIITDGYENDSSEYTGERIKKMISRQREQFGWEFMFLGANIEAEDVAESMGIDREMACNWVQDEKGMNTMYIEQADAICCMRKCDCITKEMSMDFFKNTRADHKKRG